MAKNIISRSSGKEIIADSLAVKGSTTTKGRHMVTLHIQVGDQLVIFGVEPAQAKRIADDIAKVANFIEAERN